MENEFIKLIEDYSRGGVDLGKVRLFLLAHTADAHYLEYVDKLIFVADDKDDRTAVAFFHSAKFWGLYLKDLKAAKEENVAAVAIYRSLDDYENAFGYLSTLNNSLVAAILENDLKTAYSSAAAGLRLSREENKSIYYVTFSNNYVYILNEVGLYDKALNMIEENLRLKNVMLKASYCLTEYLYINQLITLKRYDDALAYLDGAFVRRKETIKHFDVRIFYAQYLRLYTALGNKEKAAEYFKALVGVYDVDVESDGVDVELIDVYLEMARYYAFIGDDDKAYKYYKICYDHSDKLLGQQHGVLAPFIEVGERLGKFMAAYRSELTALDKMCADIAARIMGNSDENGYSHEVDLTQFKKDLTHIHNLYRLKAYLLKALKPIFNAQYVTMLFRNNSDGAYVLERPFRTRVLSVTDTNVLDSFGEFPIKTTSLPFKATEGCRGAYVFPIRKTENLAYMLIGYDDVSMYTYGINRLALEQVRSILAEKTEELYKQNRELCAINRDFLTHLNNRYGLKKFTDPALSKREDFYVVIIGVDDINRLNDIDFAAGDKVLVSLSKLIRARFGDEYSFRYDSSCFVAVIMGDNDKTEELLTGLLDDARKDSVEFNGQNLTYTVSAGGAFVSNLECFENSVEGARGRFETAQKTGDTYVLYNNKELQLKCQRYLKNIKEYLRIDNTSFDNVPDKETLLSELRKIYVREREILFDDNDIIKETYYKYEKGESPLNYAEWNVLREFTKDLATVTDNFDTPLAYLIHKLLFDFDRKNGELNDAVEQIYYLGLLNWQMGTYADKPVVNAQLINEYKPYFDELNDDAKTYFLRAYGNLALLYTNKSIPVMRGFVNEYLSFLDGVEERYNLDFNFNRSRLTVYRNASTCISLFKDGQELTAENIDFVYQCAYNAVNLIDSMDASSSAAKKTVRYIFHAASYFKGIITRDDLLRYLYSASTPKAEDTTLSQRIETILMVGVHYLEYAMMFGKTDSEEFKAKIDLIFTFIKEEIRLNTNIVVDRNIMNFIIEFSGVLPPDEVKNMLYEITVKRHISTVIHVTGVTEIYDIILKYMLKNNPEYFVGIFGGYTLEDVEDNHGTIKRTCRDMAMLHDIGKHNIIRVISNSSRRLFDFEFDALKRHPIDGYNLIKDTSFSDTVKAGILYHHKWYNNEGGYPAQKDTSCDKPLVDILSVADSIDAATDKYGRSYASAKTLKDLLEEFKGFKDTRYSGAVVDALSAPEVFEQVDDFIENRRPDLIYDVYRSFSAKK